jgi:IS6 family transposase
MWSMTKAKRNASSSCRSSIGFVEQDHRRVKRLVRPGLGFSSFQTARRSLAGYEIMAMIRKGQLRKVGGRDMRAQSVLIAELFQTAA